MNPDDELQAELQRRMATAVAAEDFEAAAHIRDELAALSSHPLPPSKLRRQEPGAMGLGTDQQVFAPPKAWKPPPKPDPMTRGRKPRR